MRRGDCTGGTKIDLTPAAGGTLFARCPFKVERAFGETRASRETGGRHGKGQIEIGAQKQRRPQDLIETRRPQNIGVSPVPNRRHPQARSKARGQQDIRQEKRPQDSGAQNIIAPDGRIAGAHNAWHRAQDRPLFRIEGPQIARWPDSPKPVRRNHRRRPAGRRGQLYGVTPFPRRSDRVCEPQPK